MNLIRAFLKFVQVEFLQVGDPMYTVNWWTVRASGWQTLRGQILTSHVHSYNEAEIPSLNYKATVWSLACINFRPEALDVHG